MTSDRNREATIANWLLGMAIAIAFADFLISLQWHDPPWMRWGFGIWFGLLALSQLLPVSARLQIGAGALTLLMCAHGAQAVLGWHWIRQLQGAERAGRVLDSRTPQEVVDDLRAQGQNATVPMMPAALFDRRGRWVRIAGAEGASLGGISRTLTVHCNEDGYYSRYVSDEHGFNNPEGLWKPGAVDVAFVGDSYTQAACMNEPYTIPGIVRKEYPATLNLGMSGNGPPIELACVREYLAPMPPKRVMWMFYQNDLRDLEAESRSSVLRQYLQPRFRAGLIDYQAEIDAQLTETRNELEKTEPPRWPEWAKSIGLTRARSPYWLQDALMKQDSTAFTHSLRMSNIKLFLNARIAPKSAHTASRTQPKIPLDAVLRLARDEVRGWGGELYFVYIPSYSDLKYPNMSNAAREAGLAAAQGAGIPVVDLSSLFKNQSALDNFAYSYSHYNERGYRRAAGGILAALGNPPKQ